MTIKKIENKDGYLIYDLNKFRFRKKVAAFDYDQTLVKPIKTTSFSQDINDWMWLRNNVPDILTNFYKKGYCIVIFTNQSKEFKVEQIRVCLSTLNIPIKICIGIDKSKQKPNRFLWDHFLSTKTIDQKNSFFVGDALGRHGDWSDSDKLFANNINLKIITPEEIFPFSVNRNKEFHSSDSQEFVIMMGYPGSGKSTFVNKKIPDSYIKLSGDLLKTEAKKIKGVKTSLETGKSVVLDSTCPSREKRKKFIDLAESLNIPVRIIHISTDFDQSKANNGSREKKVPIIALYMYRKHFEIPNINEGFSELITI